MDQRQSVVRERLITKARELSPLLARRAEESERLGRIPTDVERVLKEAGMFSLFRPRRHGGPQVDLGTYIDILIELGRGCGSVAWVTSQLNNGSWVALQLAPRLREQVFAEPETYVSAVLMGQSTLRRTPDGYVVSGRWPFCTGCYQSNWTLLGALGEGDGGQPELGLLAVPTRELEIEDDWRVCGLAATNSNTVSARQLLVPASRFARIDALCANEISAAEVDAPLYRAAMMPFIKTTAGAIAIGMAQAMLAEFKAQLPGRPIAYTTYAARSEAPVTHLTLGEVAVKIHTAELVYRSAAAAIERAVERDEPLPIPLRIEVQAQVGYGMRLCVEAAALLVGASGGRVLQQSNPLQRIERNLRALIQHPAFTPQSYFEMYGRVQLGLPPNTPFP